MREIGSNDTSVHPGFRKTLFSMSGGVSFGEAGIPEATTLFVKTMELNDKFAQYGDGMYPNEAAQATPDWQSHFWGSNYNRLYLDKLREDPDDFFTCDQCVGSYNNNKINNNNNNKILHSFTSTDFFLNFWQKCNSKFS